MNTVDGVYASSFVCTCNNNGYKREGNKFGRRRR